MWPVVVSILPIIVGASILMLGNSLLGISVALKLNSAQVSEFLIGVNMTGFFAGFMLGAIYGKRLIARVGHIRTYAGLAAIVAVAVLAHALFFSPWFWIVLRLVSGVCMAGLFTAMESWLNERATNETRGQVMTIHMSSYFFALCVGQLLVNLWDVEGNQTFVFAAMLASLSLVPVTLSSMPSPSVESVAPMSPAEVYRMSPLAAVGAIMGGMMTSPMYGLSAVFAQNVGLSVFEVSLFTGAMLFGPFLLLWPIGRLSDRLGRRKALATALTGALAVSAVFLGIGWPQGLPLWAMLLLAMVQGGVLISIYPTSISLAYDRLERAQYVPAAGALLLFSSLGSMSGPLIASAAMEAAGPFGLYIHIAAIAALLLGFIAWRATQRPPVPEEERREFVTVAPTTRAGMELDPRLRDEEESASR
ncbi:MAG: MFS transporter [Rhodovibrionaceae bacterium]|nr:MFS transporter [Rhodovibrionaceae bacterium]